MQLIKIHKEGKNIILFILLILIIINYSIYYFFSNILLTISISVINFIILIFIISFFRNPVRYIKRSDNYILSPSDGKIILIDNNYYEDEYFYDFRIKISIYMSPLNIHVNRSPISGIVEYIKYHPGKYYIAWYNKSSLKNEYNTIVIKNNYGNKILFKQIAGFIARRIKCYIRKGNKILQGNEIGFIKFGSRVDIFIPLKSKINVQINEKVLGGKTIIAFFK